MVTDSRFLMPIMLGKCGEVFRGIDSVVDVGGGLPSRTSSAACLTSRTLPLVLHPVATCSSLQPICLRVFHLQPLLSWLLPPFFIVFAF